jgi:peptidyl-prolyl cis-trans isomerase B (cyclophilin B)
MYAPKSVKNFIELVEKKYFDGTIFHRIIKNFMIQTGGYTVIGNGLEELPDVPSIEGEFASNGFEQNTLKHELGVISMARTNIKDSATSQFFICSATSTHLDGDYAAFGKTTDDESNQVVLKLSAVQTYAPHYAFHNFPCEIIEIENVFVSNEIFK